MKTHFEFLKAMLKFIATALIIFCSHAHGGETMQPFYDFNKDVHLQLDPVEYKPKGSVSHIFPVPRNNLIGTNDLNNAITLIGFDKEKLVYHEVAADFFKYVSGGELTFLPVFDKDVIGYGQTRRFVTVNLKTDEAAEHRICYSIEETILKAYILDAEKRHFLFIIQQYKKDTNDPYDCIGVLRLMDLSGKEPVLLAEKKFSKTSSAFAAYNKIFFYTRNTIEAALTNDLRPSDHPMLNAVNKYEKTNEIFRIYPHPDLPFAFIMGGAVDRIVSWGKNDIEHPAPLTGEWPDLFTFSPDGKWAVFNYKDVKIDSYKHYLVPVSEKYPHYLGSPIFLGARRSTFKTTCWTTNPISFIGARGRLHRWELTSKANPQVKAGDADFHDFIVGQDLKRLRAEKKLDTEKK